MFRKFKIIELTSTPVKVGSGSYQLNIIIGTGTIQLRSAIKGETAQDVPNSSFSASTIKKIEVADSSLSVVATGDAEAFISYIKT